MAHYCLKDGKWFVTVFLGSELFLQYKNQKCFVSIQHTDRYYDKVASLKGK